MSPFISCIRSAVLSEMPPESKVIALPTRPSVTAPGLRRFVAHDDQLRPGAPRRDRRERPHLVRLDPVAPVRLDGEVRITMALRVRRQRDGRQVVRGPVGKVARRVEVLDDDLLPCDEAVELEGLAAGGRDDGAIVIGPLVPRRAIERAVGDDAVGRAHFVCVLRAPGDRTAVGPQDPGTRPPCAVRRRRAPRARRRGPLCPYAEPPRP